MAPIAPSIDTEQEDREEKSRINSRATPPTITKTPLLFLTRATAACPALLTASFAFFATAAPRLPVFLASR